MSEKLGVTFDESQVKALEEMQERGEADSYSEAGRIACSEGLRKLGYQNGENKDTMLKSTVQVLANVFTLTGMVGLGFTFAYPVPARLPSFAILAFGVFLYSAGKALEQHEPKVSKRLKRLFGGSA